MCRDSEREQLKADVDKFLAKGGKIERLDPGACSEHNVIAEYGHTDGFNAFSGEDVWLKPKKVTP